MGEQRIRNVVFDLGGVLVDWNPKYLYNKVFNNDEKKVDWFLNNVCTNDWNMEQDAGRSLSEATELLINEHPEEEAHIRIFYDRWDEMLRGTIPGTVDLLEQIKQEGRCRVYALTNWSSETFPIAEQRYDFLKLFEGIVVSGREMTRKPFQDIYQILIDRYELNPSFSVFIDDNIDNVEAARRMGFKALHFKSPESLRTDLKALHVISA